MRGVKEKEMKKGGTERRGEGEEGEGGTEMKGG